MGTLCFYPSLLGCNGLYHIHSVLISGKEVELFLSITIAELFSEKWNSLYSSLSPNIGFVDLLTWNVSCDTMFRMCSHTVTSVGFFWAVRCFSSSPFIFANWHWFIKRYFYDYFKVSLYLPVEPILSSIWPLTKGSYDFESFFFFFLRKKICL